MSEVKSYLCSNNTHVHKDHISMRKFYLIILILIMSASMAHSQVLISLLFGDKLNSPTIKFGLDGGANFSTISGIDAQKMLISWNLGFYFDFKLKQSPHWFIHTGVLVKSTMGARDIKYHSVGDPDLDSLFMEGTKDRKINYFNIPILIRYKLDNGLFFELGPMLSLSHKAFDIYTTQYKDNELTFAYDFKKESTRLDVGAEAGIGYYLRKRDGVYIGLRYYQGLRNVDPDAATLSNLNSSIFLYASIPIGAGEKAKEKQAAAKKKKEAKKAEKAVIKAEKQAKKQAKKQK